MTIARRPARSAASRPLATPGPAQRAQTRASTLAAATGGTLELGASGETIVSFPPPPDVAGTPDTARRTISRQPSFGGIGSHRVPQMPSLAAPQVPQIPQVPQMPRMPAIPGAPAMPEVPGVPALTSSPNVPGLPSMPSLGGGGGGGGGSDEAAEQIKRQFALEREQLGLLVDDLP